MGTQLSKAARNERRKLTATYLNNVAIAFFIAGVTVPYFAMAHRSPEEAARLFLAFGPLEGMRISTIVAFVGSFAISALIHITARSTLEAIED